MVRVKRYWKLPVLDTPGHELLRGESEVQVWARRNFGREYRPRGMACQARGRGEAPPSFWQDCSAEREAYARALPAAQPGQVLVQEDKDKCAAWRLPESLYLRWMAVLLVADPVHWTHVDCTVGEVRKAFRLLHWGLMPTRLRYMALPSRWARFGLNYMYMNLKAKCFSDGVGRVCAKPGHSCLRKVVSWRSHPAVDYYRWLARAVQTLVKSWGRAYEVTSLKTAAAELRRKVALLEGTEDDLCERCGACMPTPSVLVADAAQMYEEVPPTRVVQGLSSLVDWASSQGYTGVVVSKRRGGASHLARQGWRHPPGTEAFSWDELVTGIRLALAQGAVAVGDSVWRQAEGLPIGGPHSPACCSVVLGADEAAWTADPARRARHGFSPRGRDLSSQVAYARYVDDLCMVSRKWCKSCLEAMLGVMYTKPVQFDRQDSSSHGQPWLDLWIAFHDGEMRIHMDGQEQAWFDAMGACPPSKLRLKPYLEDERGSDEALRTHVSARLARLRQAGLDQEAMKAAVERELLVLSYHGYPRKRLIQAWSRCCQFPEASRHARLVLAAWEVALPGLTRLQPDWTWATPVRAKWEHEQGFPGCCAAGAWSPGTGQGVRTA